jgi:hypothetical protein
MKHDASCPSPAVAEAGFLFLREDVIEVVTERGQCFARLLGNAEIEEIVRQMRPRQIFCRQIRDAR